jgi:hypothetical protein
MTDVLVVFLNPSSQMWDSNSNWAIAISFCIVSNSLSLDATQSKLCSSQKVGLTINKEFKGSISKLHKLCVTVI